MPQFRFEFTASVTIDADNYDEACEKYGELELFSEDAKQNDVEFGETTYIDELDEDNNITQHIC